MPSPSPEIDSLDPDHGTPDGGFNVKISGSYFQSTTKVTWGDKEIKAADIKVDQAGNWVLVNSAPGGGANTLVEVSVTTNVGSSNIVLFTYETTKPPAAESLVPSKGTPAGGMEVTIKGKGLTDVLHVAWDHQIIPRHDLTLDPSGATVKVKLAPAGKPHTQVPVTVKTAKGTTNVLMFTYEASLPE
ncbi:IPT/TIG domain-containing protein [Kitasatospora sp. NPDC057512]|uniref:IPT/TIG domain-containing protein n=1 Tax=Kitasatospora sp. NPDC057512 TaxID=3346154 RepID=UPI0036D0C5FC